jgi:hypothetical protein
VNPGEGLPENVFIGGINGKWPLQIFAGDEHAKYWLEHPEDGEKRRLFRVRLTEVTELRLIPAGESRLAIMVEGKPGA